MPLKFLGTHRHTSTSSEQKGPLDMQRNLICAIDVENCWLRMCANAAVKIAGAWPALSGARWPLSRLLSRNVAVLKVGCPWKIGGRESGHEPCRQTSTYGTPARAGMLALARISAATGTSALSRDTSRRRQNLNSKNASNSNICVEKL
jgi:hypothetical protein